MLYTVTTYNKLVKEVAEKGETKRSHGAKTKEISGVTLKVPANKSFLRTGMNTSLAALEALMFCSGEFNIELIKKVAPNARHDLYEKQSDYGPRTASQVAAAVKAILNDRDTRRAVIQFNTMSHIVSNPTDMACTMSMQFIRNDNNIDSHVTMRSSDLVYGLPMDLVMFGSMTQVVAASSGYKAGDVYLSVGSMHLYESTSHLAVANRTVAFELLAAGIHKLWDIRLDIQDALNNVDMKLCGPIDAFHQFLKVDEELEISGVAL